MPRCSEEDRVLVRGLDHVDVARIVAEVALDQRQRAAADRAEADHDDGAVDAAVDRVRRAMPAAPPAYSVCTNASTSSTWPGTLTPRHSRASLPSAVDDEGAALDAAHLLAVHVLHLDDAELRAERSRRRRASSSNGQAHLGLEVLVRLEAVARDAGDDGAGAWRTASCRSRNCRALGRAARRVVLRDRSRARPAAPRWADSVNVPPPVAGSGEVGDLGRGHGESPSVAMVRRLPRRGRRRRGTPGPARSSVPRAAGNRRRGPTSQRGSAIGCRRLEQRRASATSVQPCAFQPVEQVLEHRRRAACPRVRRAACRRGRPARGSRVQLEQVRGDVVLGDAVEADQFVERRQRRRQLRAADELGVPHRQEADACRGSRSSSRSPAAASGAARGRSSASRRRRGVAAASPKISVKRSQARRHLALASRRRRRCATPSCQRM